MFDYSVFKHDFPLGFPYVAPISPDYKVFVNGQEVPVYTCRVSAYPFNTWWPGHLLLRALLCYLRPGQGCGVCLYHNLDIGILRLLC